MDKNFIKENILKSEFLFPLALFGMFIYLTAQAPGFHARARVFPLAIGSLGILLTFLEMLRQVIAWRRGRTDVLADGTQKPPPLRRTFWYTLGLTIGFLVGVLTIGFYIPAAIFIPATMVAQGVRKPLMIIITTAAILIVAYLVFGLWLYVPLLARFIAR
jgi:hypothetical protein